MTDLQASLDACLLENKALSNQVLQDACNMAVFCFIMIVGMCVFWCTRKQDDDHTATNVSSKMRPVGGEQFSSKGERAREPSPMKSDGPQVVVTAQVVPAKKLDP